MKYRYAIYFSPEEDSVTGRFGQQWLGRFLHAPERIGRFKRAHSNKVEFFLIPNLMEYKPLNLLDSIFQTKKLDINKIRQLQIFLLLGNAPTPGLSNNRIRSWFVPHTISPCSIGFTIIYSKRDFNGNPTFGNAPILSDTKMMKKILTGMLLIGIFISVVIGIIMAHALSHPISTLIHATKTIADGNFGQRIPVEAHDEIGELSAAFNGMTEILQITTVSRDYVDNII